MASQLIFTNLNQMFLPSNIVILWLCRAFINSNNIDYQQFFLLIDYRCTFQNICTLAVNYDKAKEQIFAFQRQNKALFWDYKNGRSQFKVLMMKLYIYWKVNYFNSLFFLKYVEQHYFSYKYVLNYTKPMKRNNIGQFI